MALSLALFASANRVVNQLDELIFSERRTREQFLRARLRALIVIILLLVEKMTRNFKDRGIDLARLTHLNFVIRARRTEKTCGIRNTRAP